jgi:hypothetical protein
MTAAEQTVKAHAAKAMAVAQMGVAQAAQVEAGVRTLAFLQRAKRYLFNTIIISL